MANSRSPHPLGRDPFHPPTLTPGPLGHNDAASPDSPRTLVGDTPGPLGVNDHADPKRAPYGIPTNKKLPSAMAISQAGLDFILKEEYVRDISDRLHWPGGGSGVTLGAGYDMKHRSRAQIVADLTRIGVGNDEADKASAAAMLAGEDARIFVRNHTKLLRINKTMAIELLRLVIKDYESIVKRNVKVPLQQYEYDALVCFAYNPGGRFMKIAGLINKGEVSTMLNVISGANTSGGRVLEGLVKRRQHEVELFLHGRYRK